MTSPLLFFFLWGDSGVWVWRFRLYHRWNLCFSFLFLLFLFWGDFQEENEAGTSSSHLKTGSLLLYCFLVCPKVKRLLGGWRPVDGSVQKARSLFVCLYSGLCYRKWQSHNWYNEWVQDFVVLGKQPRTSHRPFRNQKLLFSAGEKRHWILSFLGKIHIAAKVISLSLFNLKQTPMTWWHLEQSEVVLGNSGTVYWQENPKS